MPRRSGTRNRRQPEARCESSPTSKLSQRDSKLKRKLDGSANGDSYSDARERPVQATRNLGGRPPGAAGKKKFDLAQQDDNTCAADGREHEVAPEELLETNPQETTVCTDNGEAVARRVSRGRILATKATDFFKRGFLGRAATSAVAAARAPATIAGPMRATLSNVFESYPNVLRGIAQDNGVCKRVVDQETVQSHWDVDTFVGLLDEFLISQRGYQEAIRILTCE
eukprot:jgi/Tetstr1/420740/TSEL_011817.t1